MTPSVVKATFFKCSFLLYAKVRKWVRGPYLLDPVNPPLGVPRYIRLVNRHTTSAVSSVYRMLRSMREVAYHRGPSLPSWSVQLSLNSCRWSRNLPV